MTDPGHPKILVIDIDPEVGKTVQNALAVRGVRVQTAPSMPAALRLMEKESFPVVLAALHPDDTDGLDFCRQIRRRRDRSIVYAMSAFIREFGSERLEQVGFDGHLAKPLKTHVLETAIAGAFDRLRSAVSAGDRP